MALGENTEKMLAVRFPHSYHLFDDMEKACSAVKTQNDGYGHVEFDAQGIDTYGQLIVKAIYAGLGFFRRKKHEVSDACKRTN